MNKKQLLTQVYLNISGKHLFSSIPKLHRSVSKHVFNLVYSSSGNIWDEYPIATSTNGQDILFIHIPKCAGTSIANTFGKVHLSHYPASLFYLVDPNRMKNCYSFAVIRDPIDRIVSLLAHYTKSQFSTEREHKVAKELNISEENLEECVLKFISDHTFRRKLFGLTKPGRDGFSVNRIRVYRL